MPNYGTIAKTVDPLSVIGGYKNKFYFAEVEEITTFGAPTASGTTIGDTKLITTAHTFASGKGFHVWATKNETVTGKSAPAGDDGLNEWTYELVVLGDSAAIQEQMEKMQLSDNLICLFKDSNCIDNDTYVQLGDKCFPATIKMEFDSKTVKGAKQYKVTITSMKRFFYKATLTEAT